MATSKAEKKAALSTICNSVRDDLIRQIDNMPPDWDGFELRELVAKSFDRDRRKMARTRANAFERALVERRIKY